MEMEGSVTKGMEGLYIPFRGIRKESWGGGKGGGNELDAKINPNSSGSMEEGERKEDARNRAELGRSESPRVT